MIPALTRQSITIKYLRYSNHLLTHQNDFQFTNLVRQFLLVTVLQARPLWLKSLQKELQNNLSIGLILEERLKGVETHTAGIVPSQIESKWEVGNMVLYDLAGHAEYHSSHSAVMETVMQQSPATFINVIDLSNSDDEIVQQLHYWLNFIDNATCRTTIKSCLIVVGSHADLLSHRGTPEKINFYCKCLGEAE